MDESTSRELCAQGFSLIETHISRVYLRGADVFKTKRAVALGFLDFSSLEARARACRDEVQLNRRLAPGVYLGVCALTQGEDGTLVFVQPSALGNRPLLEWAVHMRRLSDAERGDVRLAEGRLSHAELRDIERRLGRFHAEAACDPHIAEFGAPEHIRENVEENFHQLTPLVEDAVEPDELAALTRYQRRFLESKAALLRARMADGFVRDGHGDLRLEHIYRNADGSHVIIDCIEFNERFRYADVVCDLAFLSMDLRAHGRTDLAELLLAEYASDSRDYGLYELVDFYESYRAVVRAKVALFLEHDPEVGPEAREKARKDARRYLLLSLSAARPALSPPRLVVVMGSLASGKSTLAEALAERLCMPRLSADPTRKELLGLAAKAPLAHDPFTGAYTEAMSGRVYATLRARAAQVLESGRNVIVDATFRKREERHAFRALAERLGANVVFLECRCSRATTRARLQKRAEGPHPSDGRLAILDAFEASFEATAELPSEEHRILDTEGALEQTLSIALDALL